MKYLNKKGQVMQNIGSLGVGIVALVIILAITFIVASNIRTQTIEQTSATALTNVTIASWANATAFDVDLCTAFSCTTLYNDSANTVEISTTNYTCAVSGDMEAQITITNRTRLADTVYLDYSCKQPSTAFNATVELTNATQTIPGWVPLIVLVLIGGMILGLVSAFKRN